MVSLIFKGKLFYSQTIEKNRFFFHRDENDPLYAFGVISKRIELQSCTWSRIVDTVDSRSNEIASNEFPLLKN